MDAEKDSGGQIGKTEYQCNMASRNFVYSLVDLVNMHRSLLMGTLLSTEMLSRIS